jgi:O-antigen ligase
MRVTLVDASLFLYVLGAFVVSKIEGFSMLTNIFLIVLLFALTFSKWRNAARFSWFQGLSILILTLAFASSSWSYSINTALVSSISFTTALLGGAAVALALANGVNPKVLVIAAFIGSAILVVSAWRELITLNVRRAAGITGNANDLGISLTIAALLIINPLQKTSPVVKAIGLSFVIFAVFTTGSRKMLIVIAVFLLYYSYFIFKGRLATTGKIIMNLLLILFIVALIVVFEEYLFGLFEETEVWARTLKAIEGRDYSANERSAMINYGIFLWKQRPVLGYGIDQYRFHGLWATYSHNNYVETLINFGLVGLILYYFVHLKLTIDAIKRACGKYRWFALCVILLLLLWDMAFVSYRSKLVWILIATLVWLVKSDFSKRNDGTLEDDHSRR